MSDPFKSDYAAPAGTVPAPSVPPRPADMVQMVPSRPTLKVNPAGQQDFGFEPQRYGLGKPRRIVIRGKIARE
jgi:hypothetical protein